jgi:hypothetical protein
MKFSVFQISRKGGREKNEDRMGYCYTRESGLFVLADGMGGHPEGEVAAQLALQTISALYQKEARPVVDDPSEFLSPRPSWPRTTRSSATPARRACSTRRAPPSWRPSCRAPRPPGCIAAIRGCTSCAAARCSPAPATTRTSSSTRRCGALQQINRNILFTCLGSPTKPVFDVTGPVTLQEGDKLLLCSDGLWSSVDDKDIVRHLAAKPVSECAPDLVELALRNGGPAATTSPSSRSSGRRPTRSSPPTACPPTASPTACSPRPSRPASWTRSSTTSTTPPSSAPSPRSTKPSSARLPARVAPGQARMTPSRLCAAKSFVPMTFQRPGGRAADQLRPVRLTRGFTIHAEGSVLVEFGQTRVLCTASVEEKVPPHKRGSGEGWVTAEYGMLPRATHTRGDREAARGKQSGRTQEIQRLIGRSLRAVFDLKKLGERTIHLDCDVLQADGGTRTAAITGAFVAAQDAVNKLLAQGKLAPRRSPARSRPSRWASSTARRCWTSNTSRTSPATPT